MFARDARRESATRFLDRRVHEIILMLYVSATHTEERTHLLDRLGAFAIVGDIHTSPTMQHIRHEAAQSRVNVRVDVVTLICVARVCEVAGLQDCGHDVPRVLCSPRWAADGQHGRKVADGRLLNLCSLDAKRLLKIEIAALKHGLILVAIDLKVPFSDAIGMTERAARTRGN